jgi:hypothetical protein
MKKNLEKKLSLYLAVAAGVAGISTQAGAQIVYHDVVPDSSLHFNETMDIDLNSDATIDFIAQHQDLVFTSSGSTYSYKINNITPQAGNSVVITTTAMYPAVLNFNELINVTRAFGTENLLASVSSGGYDWGNWNGQIDKYVGLKFDISGTTHYGWVRLSVATGGAVTVVKDWAYQAIADSGILAGDSGTMVGMKDILSDEDVKIFVKGKKVEIMMNEALDGNIEMLDVSGRMILEQKIDGLRSEIDLSEVSGGVYIVNVTTTKGRIAKKLMVR